MTEAEFTALHQQRGELKDQLNQITKRRNTLQEQMQVMPPDQRADHMLRIKEIDKRASDIDRAVMQLDIRIADAAGQPRVNNEATVADQLAKAQQGLTTLLQVPPPPSRRDRDIERGQVFAGVAFTMVAVYAIFIAARRFFLKPNTTSIEGQARRLDQLQQSVDVIALEVERMSESQRFVAKVLNEKLPALGIGAAPSPKDKAKV